MIDLTEICNIFITTRGFKCRIVQIQTQDSVDKTFGQNFFVRENPFKKLTFLV